MLRTEMLHENKKVQLDERFKVYTPLSQNRQINISFLHLLKQQLFFLMGHCNWQRSGSERCFVVCGLVTDVLRAMEPLAAVGSRMLLLLRGASVHLLFTPHSFAPQGQCYWDKWPPGI